MSTTPIDMAQAVYGRLPERVAKARDDSGRPLTLTEKVLWNHLSGPRDTYADFEPDRVALQDALAQIVVLQFMVAGLDQVVVPTTIHCDHLIRARASAHPDLESALGDNAEVYDFLRAASGRYGMDFWQPGSGIIHQVVFENYAFPGGMMIGTDSHTPTAGGLGMAAIGIGGGDAIDVMTGSPFNLRWPRIVGVRLTGALSGWSSPKDVILRVADILTVAGGTGAIVEYFGPGADTISATGKATICNMGAEVGATTSLFPFDARMDIYLRATGRVDIADAAALVACDLRADPEVEAEPGRFFDQVIEIDLSSLEPLVNGPDTPDRSHPVSAVASWAEANGVPVALSAALIGSCTNSSYEDLSRASAIARQARAHGLRSRVPLFVTPGSEKIRETIERDGLLDDLEAIGATVLANACGPCIGQWDRTGIDPEVTNTIVTSFNRNFPRRNDGNATTKAFVTSPDVVIAFALAGSLDFDPRTQALPTPDGRAVVLDPPAGPDIPAHGFEQGPPAWRSPAGPAAPLEVDPSSERLQRIEPFPPWGGTDFVDMPVLVKARGTCTTDHISAAGDWLRYRGHLERISGNLFLGAVNAFTGAAGEGKDPIDGATRPFPEIARRLSAAGVAWCAVGDGNYGEGSSREHAAMEPRYRGAVVIFARSFARIHETNLKKQGLLPLAFVDPAVYDEIGEDDRISVLGLADLAPGVPVRCMIRKAGGGLVDFEASHTMSDQQIGWFRAGSALNVIRARRATAVT